MIKENILPEFYLLSMVPGDLDKETKHLVINITTTARILYAKYLKSQDIRKKGEIIRKLLEIAEMDILTDIVRKERKRGINQIWSKFIKWANWNKNKEEVKLCESNCK